MNTSNNYENRHSDDVVVETDVEREALEPVNAYMERWNAKDVAGIEETLHFPHIRFASGKVAMIQKGQHDPQMFLKLAKNTEWEYSLWDYRKAVQSGAEKVHFAVQFTRYKKDGTSIGAYPSLWIVTKEQGRWGIKARSSFAP